MNLPRPHLSFSSMQLWLYSKEQFRKKYYPKKSPTFRQSIEMKFGNEVTEAMERNEDWVAFIPRHPVFEYNPNDNPEEKTIDIDGVPIKAFVDSMDMETMSFMEQKTGRTPWTQNKVDKHIQLDIYSLLLQEKFGRINDECDLTWVKTEKVEKDVIVLGEVVGQTYELKLTGEYEVFKRVITQEERDNMRAKIIKVGREIEENYAAMKKFYR